MFRATAVAIALLTVLTPSTYACPPQLMEQLIEGMTVVIARARCENRPMSTQETERLSKRMFGDRPEFQSGGSCEHANFDALRQVLDEYHQDSTEFCRRAKPILARNKL